MSNKDNKELQEEQQQDQVLVLTADFVKKINAAVPQKAEKHRITFKSGEEDITADVFIKKISYASQMKIVRNLSGLKEDERLIDCAIIANSVFTDETAKKRAFTYEQVCDFIPSLMDALALCLTEVNSTKKK